MAFDKLNRFFGVSEDDEETDDPIDQTAERTTPPAAGSDDRNVIALSAKPQTASRIVLFAPRVYSDTKTIGNHLLNNRAVIVNFDSVDAPSAARIVDFLTGVAFAIHGEIKRVGDKIFLVTPPRFQVDGDIASLVAGTDTDFDSDYN
ncbi:cell division protein SepF [Schleiferilactobacillus harbinensis]|uniref:cell division protein SepF n=1 Tax=Schleiferilactobacillus harbinensis TaxID=304207 RepID=UPI0039EC556C